MSNPHDSARRVWTPDYRLTIDGQAITPAINPRLMTLSLEQSRDDTADQVTITIEDAQGNVVLPRTGVTMQVQMGWQHSGLADAGSYIVDEVEHSGAPDHIRIRGRSANMRQLMPTKRTQSYHQQTLGMIINAIAARNNLMPAVNEQLASIIIQHIDQTDESDLNFLTRLGQRFDATATVKTGHLIFAPAGRGESVSGKLLPQRTLRRADLTSHSYRVTDRNTYTGVIAYYRDTQKGKRIRVTAGAPDNRGKTLRHTYTTQDQAQHAANAAWHSLQRAERALTLSLARADLTLQPECGIQTSGLQPAIDTIDWVIKRANHQLTATGFTTRLELEQKQSGQQ